jgi:putative hydrolase of the HAD superfamily
MQVQHLFFDLDHTLWDFNKNSKETLCELFDEYNLSERIPSFISFYDKYIEINERLWGLYRDEKITKVKLRSVRFNDTLKYFRVEDEELAREIGEKYIQRCPLRGNLIDGCHQVLKKLQSNYTLHIVTNGFEEVQAVKMSSCNLDDYFTCIITSESAGARKPNRKIFEYALAKSGAKQSESIMIGDSLEVDCISAEEMGMKAVFFNPDGNRNIENKKVSYEVAHLKELLDIF